MKWVLVTLLIFVIIVCCGSREGFVDLGFSGYKKPISDFSFTDTLQDVNLDNYKRDNSAIPPTTIASVINAIQGHLSEKHSVCMEPIETMYVDKYTNQGEVAYNSRMMFYSKDHHFAAEIMSKSIQNADGSIVVASVRTQVPSSDISGPSAYSGEAAGSEFINRVEINEA